MPYLEAQQQPSRVETRPVDQIAQIQPAETKKPKSKLGPELKKARAENQGSVIFGDSVLKNAEMQIKSFKSSPDSGVTLFLQAGDIVKINFNKNSTSVEGTLPIGLGVATELIKNPNNILNHVEKAINQFQLGSQEYQAGGGFIKRAEGLKPINTSNSVNVRELIRKNRGDVKIKF